MSLWKRSGGQYWADFTIEGKRYREPLGTKDEREAKRLEKARIAEASQGKLAANKGEFSRLGFKDAVEKYIQEKLRHKPPTPSLAIGNGRAGSLHISRARP